MWLPTPLHFPMARRRLPAGHHDRLTNEQPQQRFVRLGSVAKGPALPSGQTPNAILRPESACRSPEIYSLQRRGTKNSSGTYASCRARRLRRSPMKRLVKAGLVAVALAASATAAFAMPRVPASAIANDASDAVVLVKGGHGHGHGHMGRGGRGHHYGWSRGRGHHYGWSRGHHRHH